MLDNTITVQKALATAGTPVTEELSRYEETVNRTTYKASDHNPGAGLRDQVQFYRTFPKVSGNSKGVSKVAIKATRDVTVSGVSSGTELTMPLIVDCQISVPVGTTEAVREDVVAIVRGVLQDNTLMDRLVAGLEI